MTTIREFIAHRYPDAARTHRWVPEAGDDNIECAECGVRPYNLEARRECVDRLNVEATTFPTARKDTT